MKFRGAASVEFPCDTGAQLVKRTVEFVNLSKARVTRTRTGFNVAQAVAARVQNAEKECSTV